MNYDEFLESLKEKKPPRVSAYLEALWYDKKNNWYLAHQIAQEIHDASGSWIHAYLHRVEGDIWNANYWYSRAGKTMPEVSLEEEWEILTKHFLIN